MKLNRAIILLFVILVVSSFYRLIPGTPAGFAPQAAMALMGGMLIKDKRWAFFLPIFSLFISDMAFHYLNQAGLTEKLGFYKGQWAIYLVFALIALFGCAIKRVNALTILGSSVAASVFFFIATNYITWQVGEGLGRPHTFEGLMLCYGDAIAFYRQFGLIKGFDANFVLGDVIWSFALFGLYTVAAKYLVQPKPQAA